VVGIISVAKYRSLELYLPEGLSDELKNIVLGFTQGGFPEKLKTDIHDVWSSIELDFVQERIAYCKKKIPERLEREFSKAVEDIDQAVLGLYELYKQEKNIENEIEEIREAV
jgi:hypothetical protein